ncbi:hypothetical protein [Nocardia bhagyanarayanae]|nr:hypothetical protein [Nocardia bhagyanarayanae]
MDHLDAKIAESVRVALVESGMGANELIKGTSIPPSVLRHRLTAETSFTLSELVRVAAALGRRTVDLIPDAVRVP